MDRAACKGMVPSRRASRAAKAVPVKIDLFFPGRNQPVRGAQNVCLMCEVRLDCKAYAKRTGAEYGVWAGELKKRPKPETEDGAEIEEDEDDE